MPQRRDLANQQWAYHIALGLAVLLFTGGSCNSGGDPPPADPSETMRIIMIQPHNGSLISDDRNIIHFEWPANNVFPCNQLVWLEFRDEPQTFTHFVGSAEVDVCNSGTGTMIWYGRMPAHTGSGARTIPVPPGTGNYRLRVRQGSRYSPWYSVTVTANNFDQDADGISDAVEDENAGIGGPVTTITYEGNTYYYNKSSSTQPPLLPTTISSSSPWYYNRGTHDYSLARGSPTAGTLTNGLRIANSGTGYQYWWGGDPPDTDNWGTLQLVNFVETVGRQWHRRYPSYPTITSMDMSKQHGGDWQPDHTSHQNGLDVDIRYIRNDGTSNPFDFNNPQDYNPAQGTNYYDQTATQRLVDLFINYGAVLVIVDSRANLSGTGIQIQSNHHHHFHVRIADPDGPN